MYKSKWFSEYEMTYSNTARLKGIDNKPTGEVVDNLKLLMGVLDDIRDKWGGPIKVNSGYRCKELNDCLKGSSKTSSHMLGFAADIYPYNNQFNKFVEFMKAWAEDNDFDQILCETNSNGGRWVHIGLYNNKGEQRHQVKNMKV